MWQKDYKLVWSQEFDEPNIDPSVWNYEIGYVRNGERQYYTDSAENAYIKDSCLVIEAKKTGNADRPYTSASLNTYKKKGFLYGKLEMRAKLPFGKGIWPAFWTLGENIQEIPWPACGEIDIMEMVGGTNTTYATCPFEDHMGDNVVQGTIHYPNEIKGLPRAIELPDSNFCDDFHVFGIEWTDKFIKCYCDGFVYNKLDISERPEFHKPHYVLVNLAVGGGWPGDPDETTIFPQKYYIDWIRYYQ